MIDELGRIEHIVMRAAQVLDDSRVYAVDEHNVVLADSRRESVGRPPLPCAGGLPFRFVLSSAPRQVELCVEQPAAGPALSDHLLREVLGLIVSQFTESEGLTHQDELKHQLINRLLHGNFDDEESMLREGEIFGMDLARPRSVLLIDASHYVRPPSPDEQPRSAGDWMRARFLIGSIVSFFSLPSDAICGYIGNGEIAVLKATSSRDLAHWADAQGPSADFPGSWGDLNALKRAVSELHKRIERETGSPIGIAIGRYHPGLGGLAQSYRDALAALSISNRIGAEGRVYCLADLGMAALIGINDEATRKDLARHLLAPLEYEPELLQTLGVFFDENCSPASAAQRLFVHRNTLTYRLDKITSLTGLDPKRFDDAMLLRLALMLRQLG